MSQNPAPFLVVGIGASAGGVDALQTFFANAPAGSGCAYMVILHLSPEHDSQLPAILQAVTELPVTPVTERLRVEPDHVYVVPPNQHLTMVDGEVHVSPNLLPEARRAPIDIFFRTLAESHHGRGVCVILSGTGADGSMGLKRVKERGGAVFVQNPREAAFNEMPRSAIATDLVDDVLPVADIPARIAAYRASLGTVVIPEEPEQRPEAQQQALREVFALLRARTGHDFANYKRATVLRRMERRITVRDQPDLEAYASFLRDHPDEVQALLKDLLISVTNFFRDPAAFTTLEQDILPRLFYGKGADEQVRLWVVGCATGEEAYSLAMLCAERTFDVIDAPSFQVFASDIDEAAIAHAREGLYTTSDLADVSPERLRRFFTREDGRYRVRRELRETVLFANHNILKDPPFSHIDLVSCRNVLIYLNHTAQERVMETLHFALNPGGYLFLGTAESADGASDLFATVNREQHIFQHRPVGTRPLPLPDTVPVLRARPPRLPALAPELPERTRERISGNELHQQLLEQYAPPSIVVSQEFALVHVSERAGRYLQVSGEFSSALVQLVRPELRLELRSALNQAMERRTNVDTSPLPVRIEDRAELVTIRVRPVFRADDPEKGYLLVLFEADATPPSEAALLVRADEPATRQLEEENARLRRQLRTSSEQYEYQAEELRATNEELQALNEELRSSAEELETSKEELQSINEELRTVNQELKVKVEEATLHSTNLQNLVNAAEVGTIFLDRGLRVKLFTPAARALFSLIPADYGRPLADITHRLVGVDVLTDAEQVLVTLQTIEREVRTTNERVYVLRVLPYRIGEDRIGGVVITFFDITERTQAEAAVRESEAKYRTLFETIDEGYCLVEVIRDADARPIDMRYLEVNGVFERQTGLHDVAGKTHTDLGLKTERHWFETYGQVARTGVATRFESYHEPTQRWYNVFVSRADNTHSDRVTLVFDDITERKGQEQRHAYLLKLSDALRPLNGAAELQGTAARILGEHLGVTRAMYAEVAGEPGAEVGTLRGQYHAAEPSSPAGAGVPPFPERYRYDAYGAQVMALRRRGETMVVADVSVDARFTAAERAAWLAGGVRAAVTVPLVQAGRFVVDFGVQSAAPRAWTAVEVALVEATAERTWAAVERARAEEALRESEETSRAFVSATTDVVYEMSADWRVMRFLAGKAFIATTEHPRDDWMGGYIPKDEQPRVWAAIRRAIETQSTFELEHRVIRLDGTEGWTFSRAVPRVDERGKLIKWFGAASDITERKRAEERQRYILRLSDALRPLGDAVEIQAAVTQTAREFFNVDRCYYCEIEQGDALIRRDASREGLPSVVGVYPLSSMPIFKAVVDAGRPFVVQDAHTTDLMDEQLRQLCLQLGVISFIDVPVIKAGQPIGVLCITQSTPREWTALEVELAVETAERTWVAVERARAEVALRDSEARLQLALGAANLGTFSWYVAEDRTEADARALAHFGLSPDAEATLAESLARIFHPKDGPRYVNAIKHAIDPAGSRALHQEFRIRRPDGERWMSVIAMTVFEGSPPAATRITGVLADITERKRHEANLAFLAEVSLDLERLTSIDETMHALGAKIAAHLGLSATAFAELFLDEERAEITHAWHRADTPSLLGTYRMGEFMTPEVMQMCRDGKAVIIRDVFADPRIDGAQYATLNIGSFVSMPLVRGGEWRFLLVVYRSEPYDWSEAEIALVRELTTRIWTRLERARAEEALRDSEARFRTLADAVPQVIWTNDAAGKAIYFNQRWYDYSGLSYEQSADLGWQAIVHPDDAAAAAEHWQQAFTAGALFEYECRLRRADGAYRWHLERNVPLRDERGAILGWFGSATDIEELKQAEAARRESAVLRRLAEAQEEERLRIARDLHDQLGQQITALIMGLNHLAGAVQGTEGAGQLPQLQALAIDLARESHRIAVNLRPTALEDVGLVPALERLVADWSAQSQVPVAFESQGLGQQRLPRPVEVTLFRVAQEALTNVHKHAQATKVSVTLQRIGRLVALVVEDNGRGFDVEAPVTDERPRLGVLGMRERMVQIGGTLEIEATPGSSTTVLARVPLDPTTPAAGGATVRAR